MRTPQLCMSLKSSSYRASVFSLYRTHLRQIRSLPHEYLRQFFRLKIGDDVRALLLTKKRKELISHKYKRVLKDLREFEAANAGNEKSFNHILDVAYGRKGKLKWEIMEPLLSDPSASSPPPIIPQVEKSRPPVYSQELTALLTSSQSRSTKALDRRNLLNPPVLPPRSDPSSEEARLLGPFSKRRETNLRWRYFTEEWRKVLPPLQLVISKTKSNEVLEETSDKEALVKAGIRGIAMQSSGVFEEVEAIAGPPWKARPMTRREKASLVQQGIHPPRPPLQRHFNSVLPARFLRRRYQELLGRSPVLTYSYVLESASESSASNRTNGKYDVNLSPRAISPLVRFRAARSPDADASDVAWIELADHADDIKRREVKRKSGKQITENKQGM